MSSDAFDKIYKKVPQEQRERLRRFRSTHPPKHLDAAGAGWEYISCGQGDEALMLLPGALGTGEMAFKLIMALEDEYRVISPTYPSTASTMAQLIDGAACILDSEDIPHTHILGGSFGGLVAQCFVRKYPQKVDKMILSHTLAPKADRVKRTKKVNIIVFLLPLWVIRALFKLRSAKLLPSEHPEREFWRAYLSETISGIAKKAMINILKRGIDFDQNYMFTPDDLAKWPGRILILESGDDPLAQAQAREALKALYPQARVHTFYGTGHAASIVKPEEYVSVIKDFLRKG